MSNVQIDGHYRCTSPGCDNLVLTVVAHMTKGLCMDCFVHGPLAPIRDIEVMHRAQRVSVKGRKKNKKKKMTPHRREHSHKLTRAKQSALQRLRMLYPDVYDVLYAEERHKIGLPPVPRRGRDCLIDAIETYDPTEHYHPRSTAGVLPNGDQTADESPAPGRN